MGISDEACENAGGEWFRTPCVTLKEAIDKRTPKFDLDTVTDLVTFVIKSEQLTTAYVSTDNTTYTGNATDCNVFCRRLQGYNTQKAMMMTSDTCICLYQDGMVPSASSLPDYATYSPPKFYLSDSTNGLALGLPSGYDCNAGDINVAVQPRIGSIRQQFQLSYDHQIVSAACSKKILTANCDTGMLVFSDPIFPLSSSQQWDLTDSSITNIECDTRLSTAVDHTNVIESFFSTMKNPTTGWVIGVADLGFEESLSVEVGANWTNNTYDRVGEWFIFETEDWERQFGSFSNTDCKNCTNLGSGTVFYVNQFRNGTLKWSGNVEVFEYYEYPPEGWCTP